MAHQNYALGEVIARPLRYPLAVSAAVLAVAAVWVPFADTDQRSALVVAMLGVAGFTAFAWHRATRPPALAGYSVRRVRQQHRLTSRSWIEATGSEQTAWIPVYFDEALVTMQANAWPRLYPAGRVRYSEPVGKLIDNPSLPDPDGPRRARDASRIARRLTLDAQHAIAGPFVGLLWVYVDGGGVAAFVGSTCVAAAVAIWLAAIRGSDPS